MVVVNLSIQVRENTTSKLRCCGVFFSRSGFVGRRPSSHSEFPETSQIPLISSSRCTLSTPPNTSNYLSLSIIIVGLGEMSGLERDRAKLFQRVLNLAATGSHLPFLKLAPLTYLSHLSALSVSLETCQSLHKVTCFCQWLFFDRDRPCSWIKKYSSLMLDLFWFVTSSGFWRKKNFSGISSQSFHRNCRFWTEKQISYCYELFKRIVVVHFSGALVI